MQVFKGIDSLPPLGETTVAVGSFDGVHTGHSSLLESLTLSARKKAGKSVVISFSPHPRVTLGRSEGLELLTTDSEKARLLEMHGVDILLLLEFTTEFSQLSYEEFIGEYLIKKVGMREMVIGFNHHIGHNSGSYEQIVELSKQHNFCVSLAKEYSSSGDKVSSTAIRNAIAQREIEKATKLLGYGYLITGETNQEGLVTYDEPLKLIPPQGKYSALVNDQISEIETSSEGCVWCKEKNSSVTIQLIKEI